MSVRGRAQRGSPAPPSAFRAGRERARTPTDREATAQAVTGRPPATTTTPGNNEGEVPDE